MTVLDANSRRQVETVEEHARLRSDVLPEVSIVIPVYNASAVIGRALASVTSQTFEHYEVIVVDDASNDDLNGALAPFQHLGLRVLRHAKNRGAGAARNTGTAAARGRFIAFLDADDEWLPAKLSMQVAHLDSAPDEVQATCTGYYLRHPLAPSVEDNRPDLPPDRDQLTRILFGCRISPGSTLMVRTACFRDVGPFDDTLRRLEDWDWLVRFACRWRIGVVDRPLAHIHIDRQPDSREVLEALESLSRKYLQHGGTLSRRQLHRFRSTLLIERAAVFFRDGATWMALYFVCRSLVVYPFRNAAFFRRMAQRWLHSMGFRADTPIPNKIVHVITGLGVGGAERTLNSVALAKHRAGSSPTVVALTSGGRFATVLRNAGVSVTSLGMSRAMPNPLAIVRLARLLRRERPEILQSWMYHADLVALMALFLSGRRRVTKLFWGVRCSDMELRRYGWQFRLLLRLCRFLSGAPDGVIANSDAGRDVHLKLGYHPKRFDVVDNGIDARRFAAVKDERSAVRRELGIADDVPVMAMVARLDPMKDYPNYVAALQRLTGVQALAIGAGTETLPATDGLHRLGQRDDIPRLLGACDILVLSSAFGEGFPNAVAEGMAAGLAVVATDVGDVRRVVGDCGLVVPPRDARALADAVECLQKDPAARTEMGKAAQQRVASHYSVTRTVCAFDEIYWPDQAQDRPTALGPRSDPKRSDPEADAQLQPRRARREPA